MPRGEFSTIVYIIQVVNGNIYTIVENPPRKNVQCEAHLMVY